MNILLILFLLLGFAVSSVEIDDVGTDVIERPTVKVNDAEGVVFPRYLAADMVWSEDPITGYWFPGQDWLVRAEEAVARESGKITDEQWKPRMSGYRQYAGYIVNGERKIYINSMCSEIDGWRSGPVMVMDGGSCFWSAVYNADTDQIESLSVNGQA